MATSRPDELEEKSVWQRLLQGSVFDGHEVEQACIVLGGRDSSLVATGRSADTTVACSPGTVAVWLEVLNFRPSPFFARQTDGAEPAPSGYTPLHFCCSSPPPFAAAGSDQDGPGLALDIVNIPPASPTVIRHLLRFRRYRHQAHFIILLDWTDPSDWCEQLLYHHAAVSIASKSEPQVDLTSSIVCLQSQLAQQNQLEPKYSDDQLMYMQQFLRAIALLMNADVMYLSSASDEQLYVQSLFNGHHPEPHVTSYDKLYVPRDWDSPSYIRAVGEHFNVEEVQQIWSATIESMIASYDGKSLTIPETSTMRRDWNLEVSAGTNHLVAQVSSQSSEWVSREPFKQFLSRLASSEIDRTQPVVSSNVSDDTPGHQQICSLSPNCGGLDIQVENNNGTDIAGSQPTSERARTTNTEKLASFFQRLKERGSPVSASSHT